MKRRNKRKGVTVTIRKAPWQVKWERGLKRVRRVAWNVLGLVGLITVIVLIARG